MFALAAAWKPSPSEDDAGHPEVAEAKKVVTGASSSSSHEPLPPAAREPVQQEDREVNTLRSKCRNTLFFAAEVLAREGLQHLVRLVLLLPKPVFDAHARNARELRSEKAAQQWHLAMAGGALLPRLGQGR